MALTDTSKIGLANRFLVNIDGGQYNLGSWSKAEGLDVTWDVAEYRAGDLGNERFYFPGNTKYSNIRLTRGVSEETDLVRKWLSDTSFKMKVYEGSIKMLTAGGTKATEWTLRAVMPTKWSVTSFDAGASQVSMETLELAHKGFLEDEVDLEKLSQGM